MNLSDIANKADTYLSTSDSLCHGVYIAGSAVYSIGTLALSSSAGLYVSVIVSEKISNPTISNLIGIVAGLLTTMAIFALTNPFTPLKDIILFSAIAFPVTGLIVGALVVQAVSNLADRIVKVSSALVGATLLCAGLVLIA